MWCHIKIGRASLPISGNKLNLTLSHANKTLMLSHLSWFAGTRVGRQSRLIPGDPFTSEGNNFYRIQSTRASDFFPCGAKRSEAAKTRTRENDTYASVVAYFASHIIKWDTL